jgi:hypothetical protein
MDAAATGKAQFQLPENAGETILIVEDEGEVRQLLVEYSRVRGTTSWDGRWSW